MSKPGLIYRLEFKNVEGFTIRTDIWPTDILIDDADTPIIVPLLGGSNPVVISASNNDEDKYTQIRSKSAQIQIVSQSVDGINSATFSQGGDDLWRVDIILQDTPEFILRGFLMMADNQQPFQPDPQYITLTATDHLAAIKEKALQDLDGLNPTGKYRVADLINFCLRKTGLELPFFVVNNLRAGGGQFATATTFSFSGQYFVTDGLLTPFFYVGQEIVISGTVSNNGTRIVTAVDNAGTITQVSINAAIVAESVLATFQDTVSSFHWYDKVYIDAKTFEKEIGTCEDCNAVLSKILGEDCFITQWKGVWWIMRVDEMDDTDCYVAEFDSDGVYVATTVENLGYGIGFANDSKFALADTLLRYVRPHGFIKETFNFNTPLEIPCNVDFARGDYVTGVNPKDYNLDCWTKRRGGPGAYNTPITITDFIRREFNINSYEVARYIIITPQTGHSGFSSTDDEYIESNPIPILQNDKAEVSIQWKFDSNIASSSADLRLFRLILIGNDGTNWILGNAIPGDGIPIWYSLSFTVPLNTGKGATPVVFGSQDETEWQSISWSMPPAPVTGDLYIWLNQAYTNSAVPSGTVISYSDLRFEYIPFIDGTYSKLSGQYSEVDRTLPGYFANRDNQVYVSDSPVPIFKGGMFLNNGAFTLLSTFFRSFGGADTPGSQADIRRYGNIQAFSVWNQYKGYNNPTNDRGIGINIFSGSVLGLTDVWPDLLNVYILTDSNDQTDNRYFMLISLQQDWKSCIWQGVFIEVYNLGIGKTYGDPFIFKFITG